MKTFIAISLAGALGFVGAKAQDEAATSLTRVGQAAPTFECTTLDGKKIDLAKAKGSVVLVNFFATWCGPCMAEMPHLEKQVWQKFKDRKFVMVAIGREHENKELEAFQKKNKFGFPIAGDPKRGVYGKFATQYIPRNYVIDASGKIVFQSVGFNEAEFTKMIAVIETELSKTK